MDRDDVSLAWSVWSRAAESALADALSVQWWSSSSLEGLILGQGALLVLRSIQLGGHLGSQRSVPVLLTLLMLLIYFLYRDFSQLLLCLI